MHNAFWSWNNKDQRVAGQSGVYYRQGVAMVTLCEIMDQTISVFKAYFIELGFYITGMN